MTAHDKWHEALNRLGHAAINGVVPSAVKLVKDDVRLLRSAIQGRRRLYKEAERLRAELRAERGEQPHTAQEAMERGIETHCDECWGDHDPTCCPKEEAVEA